MFVVHVNNAHKRWQCSSIIHLSRTVVLVFDRIKFLERNEDKLNVRLVNSCRYKSTIPFAVTLHGITSKNVVGSQNMHSNCTVSNNS